MRQMARTGTRAWIAALVFAGIAAGALPARAQEKPGESVNPADEKKLTFKFKDASVDGVLQYVSSVTG
ncbi:MAG TPA: hypothetical protein VEN81_17060, partial [Planctomycetota bacterium]|nr:hypothetical protein [Planctomycetota bacterium]